MNCLIRGRCGHICDRLHISRSDFQNMAVSMIFKMCTCVLRLVFVTTPSPQLPRSMGLKPGSNKPSESESESLSLSVSCLSLSVHLYFSSPPLFCVLSVTSTFYCSICALTSTPNITLLCKQLVFLWQ